MSITRKFAAAMERHCRVLKHCLTVFAIASTTTVFSATAAAETSWPLVSLPKDAIPFRIGEQLMVNRLPMRLQGFVSGDGLVKTAAWFRQHMKKPLMENMVANKLVLGRPEGEYFISVQLEDFGRGTRGLVSVSHLKAGYDNRLTSGRATEHVLSRLPSGSQLISEMESIDRGKLGRHLVISNSYDEDVNRIRLTTMMRDDGMVLEQDASIAAEAARRLPASAASGRAMFFQGTGKQAIAVISRDENGRTIVILNTVTVIEHFK